MADPQRPAGPIPAGPPGYRIPPPQPGPAPAAPPAQTAAPPTATPPAAPPASTLTPQEPALIGSLTQNGAVIGGTVMLALAVVFLVMRGAVRNHLISNRASLSSANGASWALFTFLFVAAFTVVFGVIGGFWTILSFIVPLALLSLITLVLFVILFNSATRIRR